MMLNSNDAVPPAMDALRALHAHPTPQALAAVVAAADTLAYPLMALQVDAVLLYANRVALSQLATGQPLGLDAAGRVLPRTTARRAGFLTALRQAAEGERQALVWLNEPVVLRAWVCPLAGAEPGMPAPPVMLVLSPPDGLALDVAGFADLHGLSPAEGRVLQQLVAGRNTRAAAAALQVGVATVRTHVMHMRRKTGHRDVPALLMALATLPPLLPACE